MSGQYNDPVRIVAFNTLEHWSEDVSEYIAFETQTRCDIDGEPVPEHSGTSSPASQVRIASVCCGSSEPLSWEQ
jgi:hypothetical protein